MIIIINNNNNNNNKFAGPCAQGVLEPADTIIIRIVVRLICSLLFYRLSNRAHRGSLGASAGQTALLTFPLLPDQTVSKLFEALFVVLDGLLFVDFLSSSFDIVFYLLSEPLGVDVELPNRPSDLQKS